MLSLLLNFLVAFNKNEIATEDMWSAVHNFKAAGDTLKIYLSNAVPSASADAVKADLVEITAENGYVAGGDDIQNDLSRTGGVTSLTGVDVTVTASGGTIGPFQYIQKYNDTTAVKVDPLLGWWDRGAALTLQDGESHTTDFGADIGTLT